MLKGGGRKPPIESFKKSERRENRRARSEKPRPAPPSDESTSDSSTRSNPAPKKRRVTMAEREKLGHYVLKLILIGPRIGRMRQKWYKLVLYYYYYVLKFKEIRTYVVVAYAKRFDEPDEEFWADKLK
jgi:hypothetical protein